MRNSLKYFVFAALLAVLCFPAHAKITIKEKTIYYTVTGNSGRAIKKSIKAYRIVASKRTNQIGVTRTKMTVKNAEWKYLNGKCNIKRIDIMLDIKYILPKLKKTKLTSKQLNKNWKSFSKAVTGHEKIHGKIWKDTYKNLHQKFVNLSYKGKTNCKKMQSKMQRLLIAAETKGDQLNKKFERKEKKNSSAISRAFLKLVATK